MASKSGVTNAMREWGDVMQRAYNTTRITDSTFLGKIGYSTDDCESENKYPEVQFFFLRSKTLT